jgi:hypothetical protein
MRLKKFALLGAILMIFVAFTVNTAIADEWPIQGKIDQAGMLDGRAYIVIKDNSSNYWAAYADEGSGNEMLATALSAYSMDSSVLGTYDTVTFEWLDLFIFTP